MADVEPARATELTRLWRRATWLALLFVVYGSLVPLNFQPLPWAAAVARFWAIFSADLVLGSRVDIASNVLLSMPLAFAAGQWLLAGREAIARWVGRSVIVLGVLLVAVSVEFTQQFFPPRTLSLTDIQAQVLGAVVALLVQWRWGGRVSVWVGGWWERERAAPRVERALKAYLLVVLGFSLLPLDLTINPVEIYHKWSQGGVIWLPFSGIKGAVHERLYEVLVDVLIWLPVGALLKMDRMRSLWRVVVTGALMALVMEVLQLFVHSRVTDSTNVLLAALGVGIGAQLVASSPHSRKIQLDTVPPTVWRGLWWCWFLVVLLVFWYPFDFGWPSSDAGWASFRVPFATSNEFRATNEALTLRRVGFFLPGGLLLGFWAMARQRSALGWWPLIGVAVLVEAGQLFLPGKVADLTDASLGFLGGALGFRLARWLVAAAPAQPPLVPTPLHPLRAVSSTPRLPTAGDLALGGLGLHAWSVLGLALALSVAVSLPGVPYNVRELIAVGPWGLVSSMALAACLFLLANAPMVLLNRSSLWAIATPIALPLIGAFCYALLRMGLPMESIFDVLGSPVLEWPWEWELLLRFMALWTVMGLQVGLACLLVAVFLEPRRLPTFINGLLVAALMAYPLYWVVVDRAATDNLVELMAHQASFTAASWLAVGAFGLCLAASSLSVLVAEPSRWRSLVPLLVFGAVLALLGANAGLEANVIKYDQVFSALQFLLSTDRTQYVTGASLWSRFTIALTLLVCGLAALQHGGWRAALAMKSPPQR